MSGHTPGPWTTSYMGNGEWEVVANGPDRDDVAGICIVAGGLGTVLEDGRDYESDANARLIAAAPELLAAAENVIREWEKGELEPAEIRYLQRAVNKAKGEG